MSALMSTYARAPLAFERGEGSYLMTADGRRYLDFASGIAVTALGHNHPHLVAKLTEQVGKLWHTSNLFEIPGQAKLAERLVAHSFADVAFFCNSGAEACEGSVKIARKHFAAKGQPEKWRVITFDGAFHGRTLGMLAAGNNKKYLDGFGVKADGFDHAPLNDMAALKAAIGPQTCAIMLEPIQGEGGIHAIPTETLRAIRKLCDDNGLLLIMDEVQTGMGRTGKLFAHEWAGDAAPDIMCVAKALGGGFPVGACLATAETAKGMTVGAHGSTFGGNPMAMAVGLAAFEEISKPETLANVREVAGYFTQQLTGLKDRFPDIIVDVRGKGFLIGLKLVPVNREFMGWARDQKLLVAGGGDNCVRLLPPLNLTLDEAREAVEKLEKTCEVARAKAAG